MALGALLRRIPVLQAACVSDVATWRQLVELVRSKPHFQGLAQTLELVGSIDQQPASSMQVC